MMTTTSCNRCGGPIYTEQGPGAIIRCPACGRKMAVPAVEPHPGRLTVQAAPDREEPVAVLHESTGEVERVNRLAAKAMPYVMSLFLHVGVALILAFMTMVVSVASTMPENITVPSAFLPIPGSLGPPGGLPDPGSGKIKVSMQNRTPVLKAYGWADRESPIPGLGADPSGAPGMSRGGKGIPGLGVIGIGGIEGKDGGGGGPLARFGLRPGGQGMAPRSPFMGTCGSAHHVCFVIDRSGSMIDTFDAVRTEMLKSIGWMAPPQDFHIILFADGRPKELQHKRLVPASDPYKLDAAMFLEPVKAEGKTDPAPALARAFDVLANADPTKPGKLIHLLTDGVFPDNKKVMEMIHKRNTSKEVMINTYLYGNRPTEAVRVLRQIADENGGIFQCVDAN